MTDRIIGTVSVDLLSQLDFLVSEGNLDPLETVRFKKYLDKWHKQFNAPAPAKDFGNEYTGSLINVASYLDTLEMKGHNWIEGTKGKFKICAKVFATGSTFGIKNGRISKLQICDSSKDDWSFEHCYLNYDRGWDVRPSEPEAVTFVNGLLEAFGDQSLDDSDLIWYDVYGYKTKKDFEDMNRDFLGSVSCKEDALEEARYNLDEYAVVKVISSDDEEIEILWKEKSNA